MPAGQPIIQSSTVTPGHVGVWTTDGVLQDGGPATEGAASGFGITANGGISFAISTANPPNPYVQYGISVNANGTITFYMEGFGGAPSATLFYNINGVTYPFNPSGNGNVTGPTVAVSGDLVSFNGIGGNIVEDSGIAASSLTSVIASSFTVLANVAALQAATSVSLPGTKCYLLGYHTATDGGEGSFIVGTTATANGGTIINDASGRSWYRQTSGLCNVAAWFGAAGDGTTDDTAALNAGLAVGSLFLSPGKNFAISADLLMTVADSVLWCLPGTATITALSTAVFTEGLVQIQAAGCSVIGVAFDGNFSAGSLSTTAYSGVYWHGVSNTLIRDVTVTRVTFNGVYVNCTSGTEVTTGVTLENVKVTNVGWAGIFLTSSQKVQATDCSVTTCGYHGFALDYFSSASGSVTACNGVVVENLQVNRATAPTHVLPTHTEGGALFNIGAGTQNFSLTNSQFTDNSRITPSQDGIQLGQDATNVNNNIVINGNSVSKTSGFGIDASNGMTVSNNVIVEANLTGIALDLDVGTLLDEVNITGNRIINTIQRGGQAYGIFAQSLTAGSTFVDITIDGNQVIDNRSPKLITYCLWIEFNNITWANTTITNNQFQDFLTAPVGTDMAAPVPSGIYCRDNLGLEELVVTTGTTLDATFYDGFSLQYAGATGVTNINNGWRSKTVTLQPSNGNTTLTTAGSGPGALTFSGGPSITLAPAQVVLATLAGNGQWGCFFS